MKLHFGNSGTSAAVFQVRAGDGKSGPWTYTVAPKDALADEWTFGEQTAYDLSVYGPNGYFRAFKGTAARAGSGANLRVTSVYHSEPGITLEIHNRADAAARVRIADEYGGQTSHHHLEPSGRLVWHWSLEASFGWYDFIVTVESDSTFLQRVAGHVETGRDSVSDPALGR